MSRRSTPEAAIAASTHAAEQPLRRERLINRWTWTIGLDLSGRLDSAGRFGDPVLTLTTRSPGETNNPWTERVLLPGAFQAEAKRTIAAMLDRLPEVLANLEIVEDDEEVAS